MPKQAIQAYATEIKIPYLVHFTRAANLPSIMAQGLYPIARAQEIGANPHINDEYRWDGYRDSTSVSIAFPNCQMFYKYRMENPEVDWVVLILNPSILWVKGCAFCQHNAADGRISSQPLPNLKTAQAFSGMYGEIEGLESREEQKLKPFDPTDVQAEVLVFDVIEPQHVAAAVFMTAAVRDGYLPVLGARQTYIHANNKGVFASRGYVRKYQQG